jgi:hypothetical protein
MARKPSVNSELESIVADLLKEASGSKIMPLDDKLAIIDRAMKLEVMRLKAAEDAMGSGFDWGGDEAK